jgi:hypothetical protein
LIKRVIQIRLVMRQVGYPSDPAGAADLVQFARESQRIGDGEHAAVLQGNDALEDDAIGQILVVAKVIRSDRQLVGVGAVHHRRENDAFVTFKDRGVGLVHRFVVQVFTAEPGENLALLFRKSAPIRKASDKTAFPMRETGMHCQLRNPKSV